MTPNRIRPWDVFFPLAYTAVRAVAFALGGAWFVANIASMIADEFLRLLFEEATKLVSSRPNESLRSS